MTRATDCRPGKTHRFATASGWCLWGCGVRDDGRIVTRGGAVVRPGPHEQPHQFQPAALDGFEDYTERLSR